VMAGHVVLLAQTLGQRLKNLAPDLTPRSVLEKVSAVQMIDGHMSTTYGRIIGTSRVKRAQATRIGSA
jgi:hypothetical protein